MNRLLIAVAVPVIAGLAACAPIAPPVATPPVVVVPSVPTTPAPVQPALSDVTRAAATSVVTREMAKRMPGVNVTPYASCVVNNATMAELADLGTLATANEAAASTAVAAIVRRPATSQCIAGVARTA